MGTTKLVFLSDGFPSKASSSICVPFLEKINPRNQFKSD